MYLIIILVFSLLSASAPPLKLKRVIPVPSDPLRCHGNVRVRVRRDDVVTLTINSGVIMCNVYVVTGPVSKLALALPCIDI